MSVRLIHEQTVAGALAGWIGHDLATRVVPNGPAWLSGGLIGGSIGFLVLAPVARRLGGGPAARLLVVGAIAGVVAGSIGLGFPFGLFAAPRFLGVLVGGLVLGLALGLVRWRGPIGVRAGIVGGLAGGLSMAGVALSGIEPSSIGAAALGALIGLGLALPASIGDNSQNAPIHDAGATG